MTRYEYLKQIIEYLKRHPISECIRWPYGRSGGYGVLRVGGQRIGAHRVAYALYHNEEPGVNINHICGNRACFNPAHLYVGTQEENRRDDALTRGFGDDGVVSPEQMEFVQARIQEYRERFKIDDEDIYRDMGRTKILNLMEKEDTLVADLIIACHDLLDYRRRVGAIGFQLVKLDDYLRRIEEILDTSRPAPGKGE